MEQQGGLIGGIHQVIRPCRLLRNLTIAVITYGLETSKISVAHTKLLFPQGKGRPYFRRLADLAQTLYR